MLKNNSVRLNKYISESGICSRREADKFIELGNVFINGKKAKIGDQVYPSDKVVVNGQHLEPKGKDDFILIAFNKPVGVTSTTEITTKNNIVDYVNHSERIFPIGRLDKDSQGLIFLTNNGDIVNKILRAGNKHEKEYVVTLNKSFPDQFIDEMAGGVPILGGTTKKCIVKKETPFIFRITLIQGLNRQIRRMCEHFGYEVVKLERVRIMNITLKGIPIGDWRELTESERKGIFKAIENSSSTEEGKTTNPNTERKHVSKPAEKKSEKARDLRKKNAKTEELAPKKSKNNVDKRKKFNPGQKNGGGPKNTKSGGKRNKNSFRK